MEKTSVTTRVRRGRELRELLQRVSQLHSANKPKQAEQLLESAAAADSGGSAALVYKRAQQLRTELFSYGGLEVTRSILKQFEFLSICEVKLILPESTKKAQQEVMDSKTARTLLEAASQFLHEVLNSKGRRSDDDRNAFWSSIVSLMPRDLADKRMIASAMRLLKVPRSVIKRATTVRGELEDRARGWCRITSSGHRVKVDGSIISAAWHNELLSSEDNQNKQPYAIYCGVCETGDEQYDIHWRRAQYGSDKDALRRFKGSEFEAKLRAATKTPTRPDGVGCCLKLLRKYKCQCIKKRKASECDCKICTLADVLLRRYHKARHGWRTSWRKAADGSLYRPPPCTCFICGHPGRFADFLQVSKSMHSMMQVLLPCGKMEFKPYSLEGGDRFLFYDGRCCYGKCPKTEAAAKARLLGKEAPKICGWAHVFGDEFCPLEATDQPFSWQVWEPRLRGTNADGKASYSDELVPKHGTRAEFLGELRAALETYLPHFWDHVLMQRGIKVHEALKDSVTATIRSDYAAQIKTIRLHNATCATQETHNLCVTVVGCEPYEHTVDVKKRGKRPASTKTVRKQRVSVFFGFHPSGVKPSARTFNVLREDISMLMKEGKSKHGEWFHQGMRVPGRNSQQQPSLPANMLEMTEFAPIFPNVEREVDITDGCAAQFDGKDNYYQVAVWPTKVGIRRNHSILITMHGKNICDSLSNVVHSAIRSAVKNENIVDAGTRALVLWLAKNKQLPAVAKVKKDGWWAIDDIYYGYFDPKRFTQVAVPTAKGFSLSLIHI